MEKREIVKILAGHLMTNTANEAFSRTQRDVGLCIIEKLTADRNINDDWLEMLKIVTETKSRFAFFAVLMTLESNNAFANLGNDVDLNELLLIYGKFIDILDFILKNYNKLHWGGHAKELPADKLKKKIDKARKKYSACYKQFKEDGMVSIEQKELIVVHYTFSLAYQLILGEPVFAQFLEEFNAAIATLKKLQNQVSSFPESGFSIN